MIKSHIYFFSSLEKTIPLSEAGFGTFSVPEKRHIRKVQFCLVFIVYWWLAAPAINTGQFSSQFDETKSIENPNQVPNVLSRRILLPTYSSPFWMMLWECEAGKLIGRCWKVWPCWPHILKHARSLCTNSALFLTSQISAV